MFDFYKNDSIDAVSAKFEAQKIAFAPLSFQAARALRNMGILDEISNARKKGITISELAQKLDISLYGVGVLVEMGLGMGALKIHKDSDEDDLRLTLGKIGFFLMKDEMTQVNMDFSEDICYRGAENLEESIRTGKPAGLPHLGPWKTVYEGLSELTEQQKKSWFGFDHFYSDLAFPEALPIVFETLAERKSPHLFDIGGNTAKWAIACCKYNANVNVSIIDLPGQTAVAEKNAADAGFAFGQAARQARLEAYVEPGKIISARAYNAVMIGVLVWGFLINVFLCTYVGDVYRYIKPGTFLIIYLVGIFSCASC